MFCAVNLKLHKVAKLVYTQLKAIKMILTMPFG